MASIKENLIAAKALIDTPDKWIKSASQATECRCAALACEKLAMETDDSGLNWEDVVDMWIALYASLPKEFQNEPDDEGVAIGRFNDHPATTHNDIMDLFDRAIAAQDGAA